MPTKYDRGFFVDENAPSGQAIATPEETLNKYDKEYFLPEGDSAPQEAETALTPAQVAGVAGGAAGVALGKHAMPSGVGPLARVLEGAYGAPSGSLADVHNLTQPLSADAVAQRVAEQRMPTEPSVGMSAESPTTPGGRWAAKTGFGVGEGTVEDVNAAYRRRQNTGKISSKLDKKFGVRKPGESAQIMQRMLDKSAAESLPDAAAEAQLADELKAETARRSTLAQMAENIRKAGGAYGIAKHALRTGLNVGTGVLGGLHGFQGLSDMQQQGLNPANASQTAEGAALLYAMRNPTVGLPAAGAASIFNAGNDIYQHGPTAQNVTKGISGAGMVAMPRNPIVGTALQVPALGVSLFDWLKEHNPSAIPAWLRSQSQNQKK